MRSTEKILLEKYEYLALKNGLQLRLLTTKKTPFCNQMLLTQLQITRNISSVKIQIKTF